MAEARPRAEVPGRWGARLLPGEPWMRTTFLLLLAIAAVLRLWRLGEMPFMHDELSALARLYPTLWETVRTGVMQQDTHPPGVQVFEWLWTALFGTGAFAVKLPFVLMGLAAITPVRTAMAWAGAPVALLTAALLAVLQYGVLYGQLARPYAAGLCTTALVADQLTRYIAFPRRRHLIGLGIGIVLSAYTHHFALLLAGIMALSGLLLIPPARRRAYLTMLLAAALLYLPNLPIFLHQLGLGGLGGWLAPPDRYWPADHLWWVAHTSAALAVVLAGLIAWSIVRLWRHGTPVRAALPLFLAWGLLPMLIGLAYSVWRAPVVQHSVLLFSFPYLCIALSMGLHGIGRRATLAVVGTVAVAGTATLVTVRQHYAVAYASNYRSMIAVAREELADRPGTAVWFDAQAEQLDFLLHHGPLAGPLPHVRLRAAAGTPARLDSLLRATSAPHLVYGEGNGAPPEQLARIQRTFPRTLRRVDLPEGRVVVLARGPAEDDLPHVRPLAMAAPHHHTGAGWEIGAHLPIDTAGTIGWNMAGHEFGLLYTILLDTVATMPQDQLEAAVRLDVPPDATDVGLAVELVQDGRSVFYRTAELDRDRTTGPSGGTVLIVAARPEYAPARDRPVHARVYMHNRRGAAVRVRGMEVALRAGNPVLYGITGRITGPWTHRP